DANNSHALTNGSFAGLLAANSTLATVNFDPSRLTDAHDNPTSSLTDHGNVWTNPVTLPAGIDAAVDWVDSLGVHAGTTHLAAAGETSLSSLNAGLGAMASLAREYASDHFDFGPNNEVADLQPLQLSSQAAQPAVPAIH